ncbi:hypothetical protein JZ751_012228 [Albula glossodonta]|uniref:Uncharacterized protein n=1 Tax=Albula glossodonta TaxID=121402 RepID=A0A8T2PRY1_9TELE|nr:hypothetical protein JZ751_012228 [Albula glossodonta]
MAVDMARRVGEQGEGRTPGVAPAPRRLVWRRDRELLGGHGCPFARRQAVALGLVDVHSVGRQGSLLLIVRASQSGQHFSSSRVMRARASMDPLICSIVWSARQWCSCRVSRDMCWDGLTPSRPARNWDLHDRTIAWNCREGMEQGFQMESSRNCWSWQDHAGPGYAEDRPHRGDTSGDYNLYSFPG